MFTGIISNQAKVVKREARSLQVRLGLRFLRPEKRKLELGESIAVNGVCLTVSAIFQTSGKSGFEADIVAQTLESTSLGNLKIGDLVNTERSLKQGDRIGGHFVTGHVDAKAKIGRIEKKGGNRLLHIRLPESMWPFVTVKGSIVVDGISLTVQKVHGSVFQVAIVPHTWKLTTLGNKKAGDFVNLEADLIARYLKQIQGILKSMGTKKRGKITIKTLKGMGFQ